MTDYSEWKYTPEGLREGLVAACRAVADDPDNSAALAELRLRMVRAERLRPPLFQPGAFTAASGAALEWKIECDALGAADWEALALAAVEILPPFGDVEGVPRGGLPFAEALRRHATPGCPTLLVADDVGTTGGSLERHRAGREAVGIVAFARGPLPPWIRAVFVRGDAEPSWQTRAERAEGELEAARAELARVTTPAGAADCVAKAYDVAWQLNQDASAADDPTARAMLILKAEGARMAAAAIARMVPQDPSADGGPRT